MGTHNMNGLIVKSTVRVPDTRLPFTDTSSKLAQPLKAREIECQEKEQSGKVPSLVQ